MKPGITHVSRFFVSGLTVPIMNRDECNQETIKNTTLFLADSRIHALWSGLKSHEGIV